jgi:hypothetical protein
MSSIAMALIWFWQQAAVTQQLQLSNQQQA